MYKEYTENTLGAILRLSDFFQQDFFNYADSQNLIHIIWNRNDTPIQVEVDAIPISLNTHEISTLTYLQHTRFLQKQVPITAFSFNREFYCIQDHDQEVSCNGIIFFGTQDLPIIRLEGDQIRSFELLYQVFLEEFRTRDNIQGEMLRMLLKRLIIKCTRLAKEQLITQKLDNTQIDLIRRFHVLVDIHFKKKRQVKDYADMLYKSPKTLSNLFAMYKQKSPMQIIHERIILEARRLLAYTDKSTKEIAYELGFEEVSPFNKMFKKMMQVSPGEFKKQIHTDYSGKNDQLSGKSN
ncbi:MAG: helix-turn-helix domain-containing protein [Microscillaceae bacterium]|nr:helix-turn-helix domain-containing protein [Microscillaceae bacterium]